MKGEKALEDTIPVVHTGGEVFSDGTILELIQGPKGELKLLSWDGKCARTADQFVRGGETFVPLRADPSILHSLRFPTGVAGYRSTRKLLTEISGLISDATQAGDSVVVPLTFFVFATWLIDILPVAPFLWVVTPPTATTALIKLLSLLVRRGLVVSDVPSMRFQSLPMGLQPTLLTETFRPTRRELNLLRISTRHGSLVARGGRAVDTFCAKIVFAPEPLRDPGSAGFPLEVVLPPARQYTPPMSAPEAERIAAEFQPKLLRYRLMNLAKLQAPKFDMNQFTVPMQETAYSLAAPIVGDQESQSKLLRHLQPQDSEIQVDNASQLASVLLDVLLARCHGTNEEDFSVSDMTRRVNSILEYHGDASVSTMNVGWTLRSLGLHRRFMTGGYRGLSLSHDVREKIHRLGAANGVLTLRNRPARADCPHCQAISASPDIETSSAAKVNREGS